MDGTSKPMKLPCVKTSQLHIIECSENQEKMIIMYAAKLQFNKKKHFKTLLQRTDHYALTI